MPIKVPDNLPAQTTLEAEGVLLIGERAAVVQDVRPLEIALLNLMPLLWWGRQAWHKRSAQILSAAVLALALLWAAERALAA